VKRLPYRIVGLCVVAWLSCPAAAYANGRYPAASQIVVSPIDPQLVVLRTTYGLLLSRDGGGAWDWICESAMGFSGAEDPQLALTATGAIVAGLFEGLAVSPDTGCSWDFAAAPVAGQTIVDVTARRDDPHTVVALASSLVSLDAAAPDAASTGYVSQLYQTVDDGAHWAALGTPIDPTLLPQTVEVSRSDPHRIYVSAVRGEGVNRTAWLVVSLDDGTHWASNQIPLDPSSESVAYIAAVDPNVAARIYVRTDGAARLLVSNDTGNHFASALSLAGGILGFALSLDGAKVWAGSLTDGVWMASAADLAFTQRSKTPVRCLSSTGDTLWACSDEATGGFIAAESEDDGMYFVPKLHLSGLRGVLACPPGSSTAQCASAWPAECALLGGCAGLDDAGLSPDAGSGARAPESRGCRCGLAEGGAGDASRTGVILLAMASTLVAVVRRFIPARPTRRDTPCTSRSGRVVPPRSC
jgi:hypothetical protein